MRRKGFKVGLSAILGFYALLYLATTKKMQVCDECQKIADVSTSLRMNRPYVQTVYECRDSTLCVFVSDTVQHDWGALADTACMYLQFQSLNAYRTVILRQFGDTLLDRKCP